MKSHNKDIRTRKEDECVQTRNLTQKGRRDFALPLIANMNICAPQTLRALLVFLRARKFCNAGVAPRLTWKGVVVGLRSQRVLHATLIRV